MIPIKDNHIDVNGRLEIRDHEKIQKNIGKLILFNNLRRNMFVNKYWHTEDTPEMTDNIYKQKIMENVG